MILIIVNMSIKNIKNITTRNKKKTDLFSEKFLFS